MIEFRCPITGAVFHEYPNGQRCSDGVLVGQTIAVCDGDFVSHLAARVDWEQQRVIWIEFKREFLTRPMTPCP